MHDHLQHSMTATATHAGIAWPWLALVLLGAYHGLNPAMGWLFAVALGMQARSGRRVLWALLPIGFGHAMSVGLVLLLLWGLRAALPATPLRYGVAALLVGYGLLHLVRSRHASGRVGMQVGFRDLAVWSFLMATAHGAGLMLAPLLWWQVGGGGAAAAKGGSVIGAASAGGGASLAGTASGAAAGSLAATASGAAGGSLAATASGAAGGSMAWADLALATILHAGSMLIVAGAIALLVYYRLGLLFLRRAWVNLDLVWALALVASGVAVALTG